MTPNLRWLLALAVCSAIAAGTWARREPEEKKTEALPVLKQSVLAVQGIRPGQDQSELPAPSRTDPDGTRHYAWGWVGLDANGKVREVSGNQLEVGTRTFGATSSFLELMPVFGFCDVVFTPEAKLGWTRGPRGNSYSLLARGIEPASGPTRPRLRALGSYQLRWNPCVSSLETHTELLLRGKTVWSLDHYGCVVGGRAAPGLTDTVDLNGNGIPDVALEIIPPNRSGYHYVLLELGDKPELIADFDNVTKIGDLDGDSRPEITVADASFGYWGYCGADSPPATPVVLRWTSKGYRPAFDLMWKPAPSAEFLAERRRSIARARPEKALSLRVQTMLELIYTGHPDMAEPFLATTLTDRKERTQFLAAFKRKLASSPYAPRF